MKKTTIVISSLVIIALLVVGVYFGNNPTSKNNELVAATQSVRGDAKLSVNGGDIAAIDTDRLGCANGARDVHSDCRDTAGMSAEDCNNAADDYYNDCMGTCGLKISDCFSECKTDSGIDTKCLEKCSMAIASQATVCAKDDSENSPTYTTKKRLQN